MRESQQNHIKNQLSIDDDTEEIIFLDPLRESFARKRNDPTFEAFLLEQITITKEIMNVLRPKIVCIFNALASRLARKLWRIGLIEKKYVSRWLMEVNGIEIPVYMGPMLSNGQMDIFTRERLQYDIKTLMNS